MRLVIETNECASNECASAQVQLSVYPCELTLSLSVLQCVAVCCRVLQNVEVCGSVLQCVAMCCSVLQCAAVCCSARQCVAVYYNVRIKELKQVLPENRHRRIFAI